MKRQIAILERVNSLIELDSFFRRGICDILYHLSAIEEIDDFEYQAVLRILKNNKPNPKNQYAKFMDNQFWIDSNYWWDTMYLNETRLIRKEYLSMLIENLK